MCPFTVNLQEHYNILLSLDPTSHMPSNKSFIICMLLPLLSINALKHINYYIKGIFSCGLLLYQSSSHSLISSTNANWEASPDTYCYAFGYCVLLGKKLISWPSKGHDTLSKSSIKDEYRGVANVISVSCWLQRNLLLEFHYSITKSILVYCNNFNNICNPYKISALTTLKWTFILS